MLTSSVYFLKCPPSLSFTVPWFCTWLWQLFQTKKDGHSPPRLVRGAFAGPSVLPTSLSMEGHSLSVLGLGKWVQVKTDVNGITQWRVKPVSRGSKEVSRLAWLLQHPSPAWWLGEEDKEVHSLSDVLEVSERTQAFTCFPPRSLRKNWASGKPGFSSSMAFQFLCTVPSVK